MWKKIIERMKYCREDRCRCRVSDRVNALMIDACIVGEVDTENVVVDSVDVLDRECRMALTDDSSFLAIMTTSDEIRTDKVDRYLNALGISK